MMQTRNESKRRNSFFNALSSIIYTGVNGLLTIIVTRVILVHYGSDYNGLNTAANQIVSILLVLESGFTLASNVALFSPLSDNNIDLISRIISTTKCSFKKIGSAYLILGFIVVGVFSKLIASEIPYLEVFAILLISLLPTAFNLIFATKYSVLFQSSQHEYVLNMIKIISCFIGNMVVIMVGTYNISRVFLRVLMLINPTLSVLLIVIVGRKQYQYLNMNLKPDSSLIPGTKDLMIQKFVGLAYSTAPTLIMSAKLGTVTISIYGVYNSVTVLMKSVANAFMNSPRMSLGALISEKDVLRTKEVFREYENIVFLTASIMTICYFTLIMPFVELYTRGISDANYITYSLAVLLGLIFYIECLHIPSGIFLNMAGLFKVSKVIQTIAAIVLATSIVISCILGTIDAFVISILLSAITLALMEICYVHFKKVMCNQSMDRKAIIDIVLSMLITTCLSMIGFNMHIKCNSYIELVVCGMIVLFASTITLFLFYFVYNKKYVIKYLKILKSLFIRK